MSHRVGTIANVTARLASTMHILLSFSVESMMRPDLIRFSAALNRLIPLAYSNRISITDETR